MRFGTLYSFVEDFALPLSKGFAQMNILRSKGGGGEKEWSSFPCFS